MAARLVVRVHFPGELGLETLVCRSNAARSGTRFAQHWIHCNRQESVFVAAVPVSAALPSLLWTTKFIRRVPACPLAHGKTRAHGRCCQSDRAVEQEMRCLQNAAESTPNCSAAL